MIDIEAGNKNGHNRIRLRNNNDDNITQIFDQNATLICRDLYEKYDLRLIIMNQAIINDISISMSAVKFVKFH